MAESKQELIRLLEAELDLVEGGGYQPPAGKPGEEKPMFYHGLACINHWFVPDHESECHDDCVLLDWVPDKDKKADLPCHMIQLNDAGDTVKALQEKGDRERMEEEVKKWLRSTIANLKKELESAGTGEVKY